MKLTPALSQAATRIGARLVDRTGEDTGSGLEEPDLDPTPPHRTPRGVRPVGVEEIDPARLAHVKRAFTTRRVPPTEMRRLITGHLRPRSGDLALASVRRIGHHTKLELTTGRRAQLHEGDEIVVAYGDRYAPDQFEAEVPPLLGRTNLVAAGGVAADVISQSAAARRPTSINALGLIGDATGRPVNLADFALPTIAAPAERPRTVAVVGSSMNSGKTTTARYLLHGLARAGRKPGSAKVTGTGAGGDYWVMLDAGSHHSLDFTDVGLASTYRVPQAVLEAKMLQLIAHLTAAGCSDIIIEVADGLFQQETARLIDSDVFRKAVDGVMFASGDAMGALAGANRLHQLELPVIALSGLMTRSPLAVREARAACGIPVLSRDELIDETISTAIMSDDFSDDFVDLDDLLRHRATDDDAFDIRSGIEATGPVLTSDE